MRPGERVAAPTPGRRPAALPLPGSGLSAGPGAEGKGHVGTCELARKELPGREVAPQRASLGKSCGGRGARQEGTLPVGGRSSLRSESDPSFSSDVFVFPPRWKLGLPCLRLPGVFRAPPPPAVLLSQKCPPQLRARGGPSTLTVSASSVPSSAPPPHARAHTHTFLPRVIGKERVCYAGPTYSAQGRPRRSQQEPLPAGYQAVQDTSSLAHWGRACLCAQI